MAIPLTYDFDDYQILIYKENECVYIYTYDKIISTNFSKSFTNEDVLNFNITLDIFYDLMVQVLNDSYYKNNYKSNMEIIPSSKNIKLKIHYNHWKYMPNKCKFYSESIFELCLDEKYKLNDKLDKKHKLNDKKNKLNKKKLKKDIETLRTFINDHMEVTINYPFQVATNNNITYSIKLNTPIINLVNGYTNKFMLYLNNELDLPTYSQTKYNSSFKLIKCHTLKISNMSNNNFNYHNLPETITTLIITGDTTENHFKELELKNLETLVLKSCPYIVTLHSSIMHLKSLKNIKIINCQRFTEKELFLFEGYNVTETI